MNTKVKQNYKLPTPTFGLTDTRTNPLARNQCVDSLFLLSFFFFSFSLFITLLFFIFFLLFLVACTRLYNPLCRSVRRSVGYTLLFSAISAFFAFLLLPKCLVSLFYPCPSPPACDLVSRVYGLVFRLSP